MTYRLKRIRFQGRDNNYILLQNENGPCPLLAAANGLILLNEITLPDFAIRNLVASLDDVTNMLANYAFAKMNTNHHHPNHPAFVDNNNNNNNNATIHNATNNTTTQQQQQAEQTTMTTSLDNATTTTTTTTNKLVPTEHQTPAVSVAASAPDASSSMMFYINELMQYIPKFQYGMDVNPKFTHDGIIGYEYTAELTAFDLLHIKLVHGWLIDPINESALYNLVGRKSYNELIDYIISGKEQDIVLSTISNEMDTIRYQLQQLQQQQQQQQHPNDSRTMLLETKLQELQLQYNQVHEIVTNVHMIDAFLNSTCHQLTTYGLQQLHEELKSNEICVLFRNNHFSTIYKHSQNGSLYLLITDLGYADTPNIVWEKLDVIDGDTEYCNDSFVVPIQPSEKSGTSMTPEQLLAVRQQNDIDYQLALQISRGEQQQQQQQQQNQQQNIQDTQQPNNNNNHTIGNNNNNNTTIPIVINQQQQGTIVAIPPPITKTTSATTTATTNNNNDNGSNNKNNNVDIKKKQEPISLLLSPTEESDRMLAMQLQDHHEGYTINSDNHNNTNNNVHYPNHINNNQDDDVISFQLARQLQEEEDRLAAEMHQRQQYNNNNSNSSNNNTAATSSNGGRNTTRTNSSNTTTTTSSNNNRQTTNRVTNNSTNESQCCIM